MLQICICEDDKAIQKRMATLVRDFCLLSELDTELALVTENPYETLEFAKSATHPLLFFLDIDLGVDMDGMELAKAIRALNKPTFLVFFTTKSEMAPLTFRYQLEALEFIVKDSDEADIKVRIRSCITTATARHVKPANGKIFQIKHDDKVIQIPMDEILYIETTPTRRKLNLYTLNRRLTLNGELKKIEDELDERFVRCHQSYLVNAEQIAQYDFAGNELTLTDGSVLLMSRAGKKLLKALGKE